MVNKVVYKLQNIFTVGLYSAHTVCCKVND